MKCAAALDSASKETARICPYSEILWAWGSDSSVRTASDPVGGAANIDRRLRRARQMTNAAGRSNDNTPNSGAHVSSFPVAQVSSFPFRVCPRSVVLIADACRGTNTCSGRFVEPHYGCRIPSRVLTGVYPHRPRQKPLTRTLAWLMRRTSPSRPGYRTLRIGRNPSQRTEDTRNEVPNPAAILRSLTSSLCLPSCSRSGPALGSGHDQSIGAFLGAALPLPDRDH